MTDTDLMERVTKATQEHVDRKYVSDAGLCILSTNVLIRALDYFGIHAKPAKVEVAVFNPVAVEWIEAGRDVDADNGGPLADAGGWIVQIDSKTRAPKRYGGHLCAVADGRWLLDAAFGQFARPDKRMPMPPTIAFDLAETDWPEQTIASRVEDCVVIYRQNPEIADFRHATDWSASKAKPLAAAVIREVREAAA